MRGIAALAGVAAVMLAFGGVARADTMVCRPSGKPRATVVMAHAGAFVWGEAAKMAPQCRELAAAGYRAVSVEYPLFDIPAAVRAVRSEAQRWHGTVFGYGVSAGGTLVLDAADDGAFRAVVSFAAPTDLTRWHADAMRRSLHMDRAAMRLYSPVHRRACRPTLLLHGTADETVPPSQARELARRGPPFRLRLIPGATHNYDPTWITARWFAHIRPRRLKQTVR